MDSLSHRENAVLGYIPLKSLASPDKSLDVDFHDVFGGPPRRSSIHDWRSNSGSGGGEEPRDPWSGLSEKPVFGEENSSHRSRKYPSDDFFDDIFRGDESSSPTPRKLSRDPFSSSPASLLSSPARSISFQSESFRGSSLSLPPLLSLPVKLTKEMNSSAFPTQNRNLRKNKETSLISFPSSPGASTSRFSVQVMQEQEGLKNDSWSSYRQSSLSKEVSLDIEESVKSSKYDKHESEGQCKDNSSFSEVAYNSSQFHFSIYKWPNTKVSAIMSIRDGKSSSSKENSKTEYIVKGDCASNLLGVELPSGSSNMLAENESSPGPQDIQDDSSVLSITTDVIDTSEIVEELVSAKPGLKRRSNLQNIFKRVQNNILSQNAGNDIKTGSGVSGADVGSYGVSEKKKHVSRKEAAKPEEHLYCLLTENNPGSGACGDNRSIDATEKAAAISKNEISKTEEPLYCMLKEIKNDSGTSGVEKDLFGDTNKRMPISKKETSKPEEPLNCLLKEDSEKHTIDKVSAEKSTAKSTQTSSGDGGKHKKLKKQTGKRGILNLTEETSSRLQKLPVNLEDKPVNNKVDGKVKGFVKIFNQEAPSKTFRAVDTQDRESTVTDTGAGRTKDQASAYATMADQKILTDTPGKADRISKQFDKPKREIRTAEQIFDFAFERNNSSAPFSETIFKSNETVGNAEESCEDFECTVKELPQDQNNQPQSGQNNEEVQAADAKIRKWSNGKEGNIRSLLSTLQYVLWPESGWKPVPLVDIIEGSSVRKAYQKALLRLHPDKLQQKGAAPDQKYIAEKVFVILQDAWEHFNSIGSC